MARLTIEQVAAPDLRASSAILAQSGESFQNAIASASDLLGKYQEGQAAKNDNAILNDIAKLSSEEELAAYLNSDALMGKQFSPDMQKTILGLRGNMIDYGKGRADIGLTNAQTDNTQATAANTRASTQINLAQEGRNAYDHADGVALTEELRGITPLLGQAVNEGYTYGTKGQPGQGGGRQAVGPLNEREMLARTLAAEAGGEGLDGQLAVGAVIRNRLASGEYGETLADVIMAPGQFSAWNGVTGYAGGEGALDMDSIQVSEDNYRAADAILSGQYEDPTNGALNYYNPNVANPKWGAGAGGVWRPIGNHIFGTSGSGASVQGNTGPIQAQAITSDQQSRPAYEALMAAITQSTRLSPDQALALMESVRGGQDQGQTRIDALESEAAANRQASATLAAALAPENLTPQEAAVYAANNTVAATPQERLAQTNAAIAATGEGGSLNPLLQGTTTGLGEAANAEVANVTTQIQDSLDRDIMVQAIRGAETYSNADPAESLAADLEAMGAQGMVPADMRGKINSLARDLGIEPAEAAYAYKMAAESAKNQNFLIGTDGWLTFFGDGLANRDAEQIAQQFFGGDNTAATKRGMREKETKQREIATLHAEAERAARKLQKARENGEAPRSLELEAQNAAKELAAALGG